MKPQVCTKEGTVALVVKFQERDPVLVDALSDTQEIQILEAALREGAKDPLEVVYRSRAERVQEDEEFGDYVEELLCQPFLKPEVQQQAVQWLKSKIKIEDFQKSEFEATRVIADYAYKVFQDDPKRRNFTLAGSAASVQIRIIELPRKLSSGSGQLAA